MHHYLPITNLNFERNNASLIGIKILNIKISDTESRTSIIPIDKGI